MKKAVHRLSLLVWMLTLSASYSRAQLYGNEWINFDQQYFKFRIIENGVYRLKGSTLQQFNVPISSIYGSNLRIYHKGQEIPIYVSTSGPLSGNDYIEFYGQRNDGWWDSTLYADPLWQGNDRLSMFNDTGYYFLTWSNVPSSSQFVMAANTINNPPPAEPYCLFTVAHVYGTEKSSFYNLARGKSALYGSHVYDSDFSPTEGYSDKFFDKTAKSYIIETPHVYQGAGLLADFRVQINSLWDDHNLKILINGNEIWSGSYAAYSVLRLSFQPDVSWVTSPTTTLTFTSAHSTSAKDLNAISWLEFTYPRQFDFAQASAVTFSLPVASGSRYLVIRNFDRKNTIPVLYDYATLQRMEAVVSGDSLLFLLPPDNSPVRKLMLVAPDTTAVIRHVDSLFTVNFVNYALPQNQGDFIIISHPLLMKDSLGNNPVEEYRKWKQQEGYQAIIANILDLYDQFAYGIRFHPAAINKFTEYIVHKWPQADRHMFIIGKGIEYGFMNDIPARRSFCLVPTFGFPGSDQLLTALGKSPKPLIPIGRIACLKAEEVYPYLEKAKQYVNAQKSPFQTIADKAWMKNVMHLAGGASSSDQAYFVSLLNKYRDIIEDTLYGAHVFTFAKTSTQPIQQATSEFLDSLITAGTSLITFFGHSSANSFDFNLDKPENYNNAGKYPLVLTNGCLIGNLFYHYHGMADQFVLTPQAGAIAFLGPSIFAVASSLDMYSTRFYLNLSRYNYNRTFGQIVQATINDIVNLSGLDLDKLTAEQMQLSGDPSLKFNVFDKPDYVLETQNISFDPPLITAGTDSFYLQAVIYNIGQAIDDSIYIYVQRTLADNSEQNLYHFKIKAPYFRDTVRLVVRNSGFSSYGLNKFFLKVDAGSSLSVGGDIEELSELNNEVTVNIFIDVNDILPVYPPNYSIISESKVTLKASTVNPFAPERQYVFQIDTTELFNSPLLQTIKIKQKGGVVKWTPQLVWLDSTVYYWRTSVDSAYTNTPVWHTSSFVYIKGSPPGWNQSHYFQHLSTVANPLGNIVLDSDRRFVYVDDIKSIGIYTGFTWGAFPGPLSNDDPGIYLNGVRVGTWTCSNAQVIFAVIEPTTGTFWMNPYGGLYGSIQCKLTPRIMFSYNTLQPRNDAMIHFMLDTVPDGHYLLFMTVNDAKIYTWDSVQIGAFNQLGLTQINNIDQPAPYAFFLKKNDPSYPIYEIAGDTFTDIIDTTFQIVGKWTTGFIESPLIGPAQYWTHLFWKAWQREPENDQMRFEIYGIQADGSEHLLVANLVSFDTSLQWIDANVYPYLRLRLHSTDTTYRTPLQLDFWRVHYQPVPEAALNPALYFSMADSVHQMLPLHLACAVENLTPWPMDSLLVKYVITDALNGAHVHYRRYAPLAGFDTLIVRYTFDTHCACMEGLNSLFVEVNPDNDQPEQAHFNNIGILNFYVRGDNLNPLLDVTFDGVRIMDGDLVSAKPEIEIILKDENPYVPLNDTSAFDIYFVYPDGSRHHVVFDQLTSFFFPADSTQLKKSNTARALLRREFPKDGTYQLVVQGYDRAGNASGAYAYRIRFRVINKPMISNVLNYPNPFSTATRFVFTLTGSEIPDQLKITIFTVSGKVVREIFLSELGNLRIGNNITEFSWDGTDQFGDRLAPGLYFYKVEARLHGKPLDHYDTGTDQYFRNGIGKMYLMR
ncbi:MAG: C25 family cysteine peptidase [Chitinophagales bacterium]|nr:C25 family cysteine peptidase [Chitinophagales bacterium]MDW8427915.1 C25 family cysteine peptidase [Chitinophagales bacterium]